MEINYWDGFLDGVLVMVTVTTVITVVVSVVAYRWLLREVETLSPERREYERKTKLNPDGGCKDC